MTGQDNLLSTRGACKVFGQFVALNNVDFDLPTGEKHALIGRNGAGKSTFIRLYRGPIAWGRRFSEVQGPRDHPAHAC